MSFRSLLEFSDKHAREDLGDYYIICKSRMDNYIHCLESGAKQLKDLTDKVAGYEQAREDWVDERNRMTADITILSLLIAELTATLTDIAADKMPFSNHKGRFLFPKELAADALKKLN